MNTRVIGILLFVVAALVAVAYTQFHDRLFGSPVPQIQAMGFMGGEKRNFLENPQVQEILQDRFGLTLDARRAGSIEMVNDAALIGQNPDFFWPASNVSLDLARGQGLVPLQTEIVFNSPIVLFSWSPVAEALEARGIARPLGSARAAFAVDAAALVGLVRDRTAWRDLGLGQLYGSMMIVSTDPARSNSGNQFAALVVAVLAQGETAGPAFDGAVAVFAEIYRRMGYTEGSSSVLFEQYLRQGLGAFPIVAGYENQLIEFAATDPEQWQALEGRAIRPVVLYPEPTVYSSHVFLAMTEPGRAVLAALLDPEIQDLAWRRHGFRSGFAAASDPAALPVGGIPETLGMIVPMPPFAAIESILAAIAGGPLPTVPAPR